MITIHVKRFDSEKDSEPHIETYEIEKSSGMKVLDALEEINNKYDADISFRSSCKAGQCGSCSVKVNGNGALACRAEIEDGMLIEPLDFPVIKDLIVDRSEADEKVRNLQLHLQTDPVTARENINPADIKDTKKVRSCIECYSCLSSCPVVKNFKEDFLGPYYMRYISKFDFDPREESERIIEALDSGLYECTSCGKCGEVCPKNINSFGDAIEKLRAVAYQKDLGPLDAHKKFKDIITETKRSVSKPEKPFIENANKERADKINDPDRQKPKVALFTGCMVDYRVQKVGYDLLKVLDALDIDIDIPEGQVCCGSPLLRTGQRDVVQELADINKEVFKDYDTVLTICAGCGATLKNDHPNFGNKLNVQDISEFLIDKLDGEKMKEINAKVTWHDPCHLCRGQGIVEEPRKILNMIPGVEFEEMEEPAVCCGAGGGIKSAKPKKALKLASERAKLIEKTGAEIVTTICPFCQKNITDGLEEEGLDDIEVINLIELLARAYE